MLQSKSYPYLCDRTAHSEDGITTWPTSWLRRPTRRDVFWDAASVWGKRSKSDGRPGNVVGDPQWENRGVGSLFLRLCAIRRCHAGGEAALWIQACGCRGVSENRWVSWSCQWAHYSMHRGAGTLQASLGQPTLHFELLVAVGTALWRKLYCFYFILLSDSKPRTQPSARTGCINTHTRVTLSHVYEHNWEPCRGTS